MVATVSIWHIDADLDVLYPNGSTNMPSLLTIRIDDKVRMVKRLGMSMHHAHTDRKLGMSAKTFMEHSQVMFA